MENHLVSEQEALYRTMHTMRHSYRENNWGILTLKHWCGFIPSYPVKMLDVGCGNGKLCKFLTDMGHEVTGVDIVGGPYDREGYEFVTHDLSTGYMPFKDKQFDLAVSFDVMEHIAPDDVGKVLGDIFRVAKKVVVCVPLMHPTEGKPLLGKLHRTVRPAEWWLERLNHLSSKVKNKYITITPDLRDGMNSTNKLIFYGESV